MNRRVGRSLGSRLGTRDDDPVAVFVRGATVGAFVGAVIAGSTIWRRLQQRAGNAHVAAGAPAAERAHMGAGDPAVARAPGAPPAPVAAGAPAVRGFRREPAVPPGDAAERRPS